jgi:hypothetical protein
MEQHLSVRLGEERFLARPWLPRAHSLFLVRLRFVPASRFALGRNDVHGQARAQQSINQDLISGSIATLEGFRLLLCLASSTQCKTDE